MYESVSIRIINQIFQITGLRYLGLFQNGFSTGFFSIIGASLLQDYNRHAVAKHLDVEKYGRRRGRVRMRGIE